MKSSLLAPSPSWERGLGVRSRKGGRSLRGLSLALQRVVVEMCCLVTNADAVVTVRCESRLPARPGVLPFDQAMNNATVHPSPAVQTRVRSGATSAMYVAM
jgi:hypothetical protein